MSAPFCRDCKWLGGCPGEGPICLSPKSPREPDLVTGELTYTTTYCKSHRITDNLGTCGTEGRWFEPKESP